MSLMLSLKPTADNCAVALGSSDSCRFECNTSTNDYGKITDNLFELLHFFNRSDNSRARTCTYDSITTLHTKQQIFLYRSSRENSLIFEAYTSQQYHITLLVIIFQRFCKNLITI